MNLTMRPTIWLLKLLALLQLGMLVPMRAASDVSNDEIALTVMTLDYVSNAPLYRINVQVLRPLSLRNKLLSFYLSENERGSQSEWLLPGNIFTFSMAREFLDGGILGLAHFEDLKSPKKIEFGDLYDGGGPVDAKGLLENHPTLCEVTASIDTRDLQKTATKAAPGGETVIRLSVLQPKEHSGAAIYIHMPNSNAYHGNGLAKFFCLRSAAGKLDGAEFKLRELFYVRFIPIQAGEGLKGSGLGEGVIAPATGSSRSDR